MARETRRIGIRTAQVRLPGPASAGPALVRTAAGIANREFDRLADIRVQEAQLAARNLDFERDGEGNLLAPTVPVAENGLLAPSIYDREYTQMVGQRYLQQTQIDVNERINLIAAENPFDPEAFRTLAEGYVEKVTQLAPEFVKADVNNVAQIKMVEHFNHIIRVKAERDHTEATGLQLQTVEGLMSDLAGYVAGGADPEVIGAKMLEARAAIEQGDEMHFWLDDEKAEMLDAIDRQYAVASISRMVTSLPQGDDVAATQLSLALDGFANGEGTFPMIDEFGNISEVPLDEMPIAPAERTAIAEFAQQLIAKQAFAFENFQDAKLKRDWQNFFNEFSPDALARLEQGLGYDREFLFREFDKAHNNVLTFGYDDALREEIRRLITEDTNRGAGSGPSQWMIDFQAGFQPWQRRYEEELAIRLGDVDPRTLSPEELRDIEFGARMAVGNVSGGNQQTVDGAREIRGIYASMTGRDYSQDFLEELIRDPDANPQAWKELEWQLDTNMSKIGIIPQEFSNAIIGKINAPEGVNIETMDGAMKLARMLWDNPTFRNNFTDENALGRDVGGALDHVFRYGGERSVATIQKHLENYSDPNYSPRGDYALLTNDEKESFNEQAQSAITDMFVSTWKTAWVPSGLQRVGLNLNPFDGPNLAGIPKEVMDDTMRVLIANHGFIDPNDKASFGPFINSTVRRVMHEKGYAPSQMGYSQLRHGNQFEGFFNWSKPESAIVQRPPEYFGTRNEAGDVDMELMGIVRGDFQDKLNFYGDKFGETWKVDVNAALEYSGQASKNNGYPSWQIRLLNTDGTTEILTEDGDFGGDRVIFDMRRAEKAMKKIRRDREILRNELIRRQRTDFQSGVSGFPVNPGTAQ